MRRFAVPALLVLLAAACDSAGSTGVVTVNATGTAIGLAFVDKDGNGRADPTDAPLSGVKVSLLPRSGTQAVASGVTNATGLYVLANVPVGSYRVSVDSASAGDSLSVARIDTVDVTLGKGDTLHTTIAFVFPSVSPAQARLLPAGRKVQVVGTALNGWTTFADSTINLVNAGAAIRATRVAPVQLVAGDSVRITGTIGTRDGQTVLTAATAAVLAAGRPLPAPVVLGTAAAAANAAGRYDATLVQVTRGVILSAQNNNLGDYELTVDDGSGVLRVVLTGRAFNNGLYTAGAQLAATGILVPAAGANGWVLRPRNDADLQVSFQTVNVATARTLPVGRQVQVLGLALNGWATFGDSTVHVLDATGSIRGVRLAPASVFAGDSVRILGFVASRDGQAILSSGSVTVLAAGRSLPDPAAVTTLVASGASGGKADAGAVKVVGAAIKDTLTLPNGDYRIRVDDGSGLLEVILDRDLGLRLTPFLPGVVVDVTGLLIPKTGGGSWMLKPRSAQDTNVH